MQVIYCEMNNDSKHYADYHGSDHSINEEKIEKQYELLKISDSSNKEQEERKVNTQEQGDSP